MSTSRLPEHEQRILDEMERMLRRDRRLNRRLRTLRPRRRPLLRRVVAYRPRLLTVAALLALSLGLMVTGTTTSQPGLIWAFAAVWPVTLFAGFRLLCRCAEG
ncbi:DUF3040 domain-containing protein [Streptomyces sp. H51]|uniref:DUF3040 domain-containing protein n=1 Tax=Streptomyces sp. H51 TaxID=3111770 RepID=UPI002D78EA31|nr:DUF3040 domain-containing protein [Streptomyces sp. H51]